MKLAHFWKFLLKIFVFKHTSNRRMFVKSKTKGKKTSLHSSETNYLRIGKESSRDADHKNNIANESNSYEEQRVGDEE